MDKQTVGYLYHEILHSTKEGHTICTHNNLNGFQEHYPEGKR